MSKKKSKTTASDLGFRYHENLRYILRDLQTIDSMIPRESSRYPAPEMGAEEKAIIIHRKENLLRMIQTMCRDHMIWGNKLLADGWEPDHKGKFGQKADYRRWDYMG